jgi:hypothetical protein
VAAIAGANSDAADATVYTAWTLLSVFGLIGMHLHQQRASGVFGEIATLVALLGTVTLFATALVQVGVVPALPSGSPLLDAPPPTILVATLVGLAVYLLGWLMFGVATWRAGVLPWRAAALLLIGMGAGGGVAAAGPWRAVRLRRGSCLAGSGHGGAGPGDWNWGRAGRRGPRVATTETARPHWTGDDGNGSDAARRADREGRAWSVPGPPGADRRSLMRGPHAAAREQRRGAVHQDGAGRRNHPHNVSNTFTKLQVADRAQAIITAREARAGLTPQEDSSPIRLRCHDSALAQWPTS